MERRTNLVFPVLAVVLALLGSAFADNPETRLGLARVLPPTTVAARKDGDDDETEEPEAAAADDEAETPAEPNLSHPKVQELVQAAVSEAVDQANEAKDKEWQGHKDNHDKLLEQHRGLKDRLEAIELKQKAEEAGVDEEKFKSQVDAAAQIKYDARKGELDELLKAATDRAEKAEAKVVELEEREKDAWLDAELVRASMPEDTPQSVQPGAWSDLKRRVRPLVERWQPDKNSAPVARIMKDGSIVPGDGPSGHMTLRELITKARVGKGPLSDIGYFFISAGRGSGTKSTVGVPSPGTKWSEMTATEKAAYGDEHGMDAVKAAIEAEFPPN